MSERDVAVHSVTNIGFSPKRVETLADHLARINRDRPAGIHDGRLETGWIWCNWFSKTITQSRNCISVRSITTLFDFGKEAFDIVKKVELPLATRLILSCRSSKRLMPIPLASLMEKATSLVESAAKEVADAKGALTAMAK